jgi:hypothetical protein
MASLPVAYSCNIASSRNYTTNDDVFLWRMRGLKGEEFG